ncbi:MAG: sulfite exporter TauE/SafE family protein [Gammaproteobacteria bacterium]|nr:sulfite exporter TauE/SafE family protein [Gammaproteobacteria bacterium]
MNPAAGFLVGTLVGFTGVGGGALMTPILVLLFGVVPHTAVGTDLLMATITKTVGSSVHWSRGAVDWQVVRRLWLGSLPAAAATLVFLHHAETDSARVSAIILPMLGVALLLTSLGVLFKPALHRLGKHLRSHFTARFKRAQPALTVLAGAILGVLVTLTSVGAGALGTVMLVYLYPFRMHATKLVGTDIAHAVPLTLVAGLGHLALGNVDLALLAGLLAGSIPGIVLGALLSHRVDPGWVTKGIAVTLALIAAKLLLK